MEPYFWNMKTHMLVQYACNIFHFVHGFLQCKSMVNFETFCWDFSFNINLLFLKSMCSHLQSSRIFTRLNDLHCWSKHDQFQFVNTFHLALEIKHFTKKNLSETICFFFDEIFLWLLNRWLHVRFLVVSLDFFKNLKK